MTGEKAKAADGGTLERLASKGEEALKRVYGELDRNARTHDALQKLVEARGRLEKVSRSVLRELGIAPAEEVEKLHKEVSRLERRLAKLEKEAGRPRGPASGVG